jgi:putative transposase
LAHIQGVVATDPTATRWHFVVDNLDIHRAESLVRHVAQVSGLDVGLGEKGERGILANRQSRAAFLREPSHRVVFHYTPKHGSWLNQIEIGLSILVRKLLRRGSFVSVADLQARASTGAPALPPPSLPTSPVGNDARLPGPPGRCIGPGGDGRGD